MLSFWRAWAEVSRRLRRRARGAPPRRRRSDGALAQPSEGGTLPRPDPWRRFRDRALAQRIPWRAAIALPRRIPWRRLVDGALARRVRWRWLAGGALALVLAAALDTATAHDPAWAADTINAAHALGLSSYRAVPFRRERLMPYTAVTVDDPALPVGMHQIRQPGLTGTAVETGIALYRGPVPRATAVAAASRAPTPAPAEVKVLATDVVAAPHEAVIAVGTSTACVPVNGRCYHFSKVLAVTATAYDATWASNGPWTGGRSAIGLPLDYGIVAVDPSVIPLGSRLYIDQYGLAVAADTGSAISGKHIDLFFWDTPAQTSAFGIRHLKAYIIDDPRLPPVPVPATIRRALG